jgi:PleD family two-component response regulator
MDESWILIDQGSGLHVGWYFWIRVLDEANRAARYGHPFGLALLEVERKPGAGHRAVEDAISRVAAAIRSTDLGGLLGEGRVGVVLPHQDPASADAATARIIDRLEAAGDSVTWHARLLCYPGDAAEISNLLTTGWPERRNGERPGVQLPA